MRHAASAFHKPAGVAPTWEIGPADAALGAGIVHVWRADLDHVGRWPADLLTPAELARAGRIASERASECWAVSRGILRALLGRYLHAEPRRIVLTAGSRGKPALSPIAGDGARREPRPREPGLEFNLAHSGAIALFAFSRGVPVGVDVEVPRRLRSPEKLAARMFGSREARRIAALPPGARMQAFLSTWVRHEAELKCLGAGLANAGAQPRGRAVWTSELDLGSHATGAVATLCRPASVACWQWSDDRGRSPSPETTAPRAGG